MDDSPYLRIHSRVGPLAAIVGAILLVVGTWLHPMTADPNVPLAAFAEYAAAPHWVASHMMQLFGVVLIVTALVLLSHKLEEGEGAAWAALGEAGAVASLAATAALQAVDGIALKAMVDRWAAVSGPDRAAIFQATFGVRQIEVGLASISSMLFGLTTSVYGVALLTDRRFPRWLGAGAIAGGVPTVIAGFALATTGFSDLAMDISMPSAVLLILWIVALGAIGWRRAF